MNTGILKESDIIFVARKDDVKGVAAVEMLKSLGFRARVYQRFRQPKSPYVAVFGINTNDRTVIGGHGRYLRCASYRLAEKSPKWAKRTPLMIGVFEANSYAMWEAAKAFTSWKPGAVADWIVPWARTDDPFKPEEAYIGSKIEDRRELLAEWRLKAINALGKANLADILNIRLPAPIYPGAYLPQNPNVLLLGCAVFNDPHTDVGEKLVPEKAERVRDFMRKLVTDLSPHVSLIRFPLVAGDFMGDEMLRSSLHPFLFDSIESIEEALNVSWPRQGIRHQNNHGKRTDRQIAESLDTGAELVIKELVEPVSIQTGVPIKPIRWTELFGQGLLKESWRISRAIPEIVEKIYFERVEGFDFWKTLDQYNRGLGLRRAYGNVGIYIASALYQLEHPNTIIVDLEVHFEYWKDLKEFIVNEIWKGQSYLIYPTPGNVHQPWAY